jgi:hypothetical protein
MSFFGASLVTLGVTVVLLALMLLVFRMHKGKRT